MNQGHEIDDDIEPSPEKVPFYDAPADEKMFEGQAWGWYGIYLRTVVS